MTADPVLHWYDLTCPFCYVGQARNGLFSRTGLTVVELPFQAHPGIPPGGLVAGPRRGPMYTMIEAEARAAGLELHWPPRIPDSRRALAAAEWVRRHQPDRFPGVQRALFHAHFAAGEDLADPAVIDAHASVAGVDIAALDTALADGSAFAAVSSSEQQARHVGVTGTPAWLVGDELIIGLQPDEHFERVIEQRAS